MELAALLDNLPVRLVRGSFETRVTSVTEDSRCVERGGLFIARPGGSFDGRRFIPDAVNRGAAAVLSDEAAEVPEGVAWLATENVPRLAAAMAERFMGLPSERLQLIGVTGTNGKTTTSHLIHQVLNRAGMRCGLIGTVEVDDGSGRAPAGLTTPPAIELSAMLARMVENGCTVCVMEVSSHALAQERVAALAYDLAVFTNLSGDHMDYHDSEEAYVAAKAQLFAMLPSHGLAIVNADDAQADQMVRDCSAHVLRCSMRSDGGCRGTIRNATMTGTDVTLRGPWGELAGILPLCGKHNVMNALEAVAVCHRLGVRTDALQEAILSCSAPPGRLEPVTTPDDPFAVYVDYAHTDDALENVLQSVRPLLPDGGRLRVVFGCGGDRDRTKRPRMAQVTCRYADAIIITSDNPRTEDPQAIVDEVAAGVPQARRDDVQCIVDRREAILAVVREAQPGDIVLIAGKGHEDYQIIGTEKRSFDDRVEARHALAARTQEGHDAMKVTTR